jgi:hypothetical protein
LARLPKHSGGLGCCPPSRNAAADRASALILGIYHLSSARRALRSLLTEAFSCWILAIFARRCGVSDAPSCASIRANSLSTARSSLTALVQRYLAVAIYSYDPWVHRNSSQADSQGLQKTGVRAVSPDNSVNLALPPGSTARPNDSRCWFSSESLAMQMAHFRRSSVLMLMSSNAPDPLSQSACFRQILLRSRFFAAQLQSSAFVRHGFSSPGHFQIR